MAIAVPILQLIEQRCLTPSILVVRNKGGNPLALCAAAYMLATSLPRMIERLIATASGFEDVQNDTINAADGANADAGDEAVADDAHNGQGSTDEADVGLSGGMIVGAGNKMSKLLARGVAAKEVSAKELVKPAREGSRGTVGGGGCSTNYVDRSSSKTDSSRAMTASQTGETAEQDDAANDDL